VFYFEGHAIYIGKRRARTAAHILHTPELIAIYGDDGTKLAEFDRSTITPGSYLSARAPVTVRAIQMTAQYRAWSAVCSAVSGLGGL
jgi:hypothetical protein